MASGGGNRGALDELRKRHEDLRAAVGTSLSELDTLIGGLER